MATSKEERLMEGEFVVLVMLNGTMKLIRYHQLEERARVLKAIMENDTSVL
jgi:hypothetical protein